MFILQRLPLHAIFLWHILRRLFQMLFVLVSSNVLLHLCLARQPHVTNFTVFSGSLRYRHLEPELQKQVYVQLLIYTKISIGFQVTEVEKAISHPQIHLTRRDFLGSRPLILSQIKVLECGEPELWNLRSTSQEGIS